MARIIVATDGQLGIGLQAGYGVMQGRNDKFRYFSATGLPYGPNQPTQNLPPELGRFITPRGQFKQGIWGAGGLTMLPRYSNDFGQLLLAALGSTSVTDDVKFSTDCVDDSHTGSYIHTFTFSEFEADLPYFTVRRSLPHVIEEEILGEQILDNHIGSLECTLPAAGPMTATIDMMGRIPGDHNLFRPDPNDDWELLATVYDDDNAFGLGVHEDSFVTLRLGDELTRLSVTGCVATLTNTLLPPDQGRIVGSPTPEDYPVLARACVIRVTVLLHDYELCKRIITNNNTRDANDFDAQVYQGDCYITAYSPLKFAAAGGDLHYALQIRSTNNNVSWALQAPPALTPQQPIILNLVGTVQRQTEGSYVEYRLQNDQSAAYSTASYSGYVLNMRPDDIGAVEVDPVSGLGDEPDHYEYSAGSLISIEAAEATDEHQCTARLACQLAGDVPNGDATYQIWIYDGTPYGVLVAESNQVTITDNTANGKVMLTNLPIIGNYNKIADEIMVITTTDEGSAGVQDGWHQYAVTFLYSDGTESLDLYITDEVEADSSVADQSSVDIELPIGGADVTGRRIYRRTHAAGVLTDADYFRFLADVSNNTDTEYNDQTGALTTSDVKSFTLQRRVYRTHTGDPTGYKLIDTITDDQQTWYLDNTETGGVAPATIRALTWAGLKQDIATKIEDGGNLPNGDITYRITFVDNTLTESLWLLESNLVTTDDNDDAVSLADIPLGPSDTIKRRIYRDVGGGGYQRCGELDDNTTTTFIDTTDTASPGDALVSPTTPLGVVGSPVQIVMNAGKQITAQFTNA